jgi:hypothetical protein
MIKQAKEMAYSNDPTNQYGDPILVKVVHEDDIDDVAFTNESVNEGKDLYHVIVRDTGEIISDDGGPFDKSFAKRFAAKKKGWIIKKVDESLVNEGKWMDLWDESQDKAPSAWTKHQKWIVANAERYGFDPIKVKKLLRQHTAIHNRTYGMFASVEDWMEEKLKVDESVNEDSTPSIEDVRLYIQKELGRAGEQDSGLDAYIDSIQRDFAAGRDAYDDYEMDDYLEDFENYIADKMDY